ncbi:diguanylate cyclase [candidate division WOR-3 bacterium]|nr:diguanylate cyclase [candidate division WOR-3 bacterium]
MNLPLPAHALYLYQWITHLTSEVSDIINRGLARREKIVYVGGPQTCGILRKHYRSRIKTVSKGVSAKSLASWAKSEYRKLPRTRKGLRVLIECGNDHLRHEPVLDELIRQPGGRIFFLCMYDIGRVNSLELLEILRTHPHVFTEHLIQPNCFYSRVKRQDWIDTLTGVFDRDYFTQKLHTELQRASRYEHNLSILLIDVDKMRAVNREFDTQTGDSVLQQLARILERSLRSIDLLARYGGDKFVALLPETKKTYAQKTAQRIMRSVRSHDFFKDDLRVKELSLTIGIAGFPEDAGNARQMLKKAEDALRRAKRRDRGLVPG